MTNKFVTVPADSFAGGFTYTPNSELGLFRIRGFSLHTPIENHQFVLADIQDLGHRLLVHVFYGGRERFVVENASDPASKANFSLKHAGATKKNLKPGEIMSSPETYTLTWNTYDLSGRDCLVTLHLTPRYSVRGLRLFYTLTPTK